MSTPNGHPITLNGVMFTKCLVEAVPGHEPPPEGTSVPGPENSIEVSRDPERGPGWYAATMRTVINPTMDRSAPYSIEMRCAALLHADETLSEEEANRGVFITAHSVLYGAIRESVAWLTGRQPYGTLMLGLSVLRPAPKAEAPTDEKS